MCNTNVQGLTSLKETVRILKPGGSVEIIEEDILFPCTDSPITRTPRASPTLRGRASRSHSGASRITEYSDDDTYDEFLEDYYPSHKSRSIDTVSGGRFDQVGINFNLVRSGTEAF